MTVLGLRDGGEGEESDCNSQDLSMLLRLEGPEALAEVCLTSHGAARPALVSVYLQLRPGLGCRAVCY